MAFEDITKSQRSLVERLVDRLATGSFAPEFIALATLGRGWSLQLRGQGGAEDASIDGFAETDLRALSSTGYITLVDKRQGLLGSLTAKAFDEYKAARSVPAPRTHIGLGTPVKSPTAAEAGFDEGYLKRVESDSKALLEELHQNFDLSRKQSASWFKWTLIVSIAGFAALALAAVLAILGTGTVAGVTAVGGAISEFVAAVFSQQVKAANKRQDLYHQDLITRQKVMDAVQMLRLMKDGAERNRVVESIIRQLLGVSDSQPEG